MAPALTDRPAKVQVSLHLAPGDNAPHSVPLPDGRQAFLLFLSSGMPLCLPSHYLCNQSISLRPLYYTYLKYLLFL